MKFKCIVFDFDGTLADTHVGIVRTFQETFRQMGLPVLSEEEISATIGLTLKDGFHAAVKNLSEAQADEAAAIYRKIFPGIAIPCITVFPGIIEVLGKLKDRGIRMAVAPSRSHQSLGTIAANIGVDSFFEVMYGAEDVVNHKPAPDMVMLALDFFKLTPDEVLVVGDANYDLLMGQGAGCRVCGVTWGNQSREKLASVNPDYIIDDIHQLLDII